MTIIVINQYRLVCTKNLYITYGLKLFLFSLVIVLLFPSCACKDEDYANCKFEVASLIEVEKKYTLYNKSELADSWEWEITPGYYSYEDGTGENSEKPVVSFQYAGPYQIKLRVENECGPDSTVKTINVNKYSIVWKELENDPMPHVRGWTDAVVWKDKIYLSNGTYSEERSIDVFNPQNESWEEGITLDEGFDFFGNASLLIDDELISFGGFNGPEFGARINLSAIGIASNYNFITGNLISNAGSLPFNTACFSAATIGNNIYVGGGTKQLPFSNDGHYIKFFKFDIETNIWTELPDLPMIMTFAAAEIVNEKMYFFGGEFPASGHTGRQTINVFDLISESWETVSPDFVLTYLSWGQGSCVVDNFIVVAGGESYPAALKTVNLIDTENQLVYEVTHLPENLLKPLVCSYNNKLYVFGGSGPVSLTDPLTLYDKVYIGEIIEHPEYPQ